MSVLPLPLGRAARPRRPSSSRRAAARASGPPASPAGSSRAAASTSALLVSERPGDDVSAARFTSSAHASARRCSLAARRDARRGCARSSPTPATPTPATASAGSRPPRRSQALAASCSGSQPSAGRGRIDRRDRRAASDRAPSLAGIARRRARSSRGDGDDDFAHAIRTTDALRKRACLEVELAGGAVRLCGPGEGRRDDLAAVRDAALLRPDRRRAVGGDADLLHRRDRQALVRPDQRRRPALDQRHGFRCSAQRRGRASGSSPRPTTSCASARRWTRCCAQLALEIVARRRGRAARRAGSSCGGDDGAVERVARAIANSPLVKTALYGADPNWGRIVQAVGHGAAGHRAARGRHRDRGDRGVCRRGGVADHDAERSRPPSSATRSSTRSALPGEGGRRSVLLRSWPRYVTFNAEYTT